MAWCESTRICCASFQIYLFGAAREGNTKSKNGLKNGHTNLREGLAHPAPLQCGLFLQGERVIFFRRTDLKVDWERTQNYYVRLLALYLSRIENRANFLLILFAGTSWQPKIKLHAKLTLISQLPQIYDIRKISSMVATPKIQLSLIGLINGQQIAQIETL